MSFSYASTLSSASSAVATFLTKFSSEIILALTRLFSPLLKTSAIEPSSALSKSEWAKMTFAEFCAHVRASPAQFRALPVASVVSYNRPRGGIARNATGHQFVLAEVLQPETTEHTYLRFDFSSAGGWTGLVDAPGILSVQMSDDHQELSEGRVQICQLATAPGQAVEGGPSLDALAAFCTAIEGRVGRGYNVFGRNCVWMHDLMVFAMARQFAAHWQAGQVAPKETMRRYLGEEIGMLEAKLKCSLPDRPIQRWFASVSETTGRRIKVFSTRNDKDRFLMHNDELNELLRDWNSEGWVPAAYPT